MAPEPHVSLEGNSNPPSNVTEGAMRWENINTISGMVERGRNIINNAVIPDYMKYLKKNEG